MEKSKKTRADKDYVQFNNPFVFDDALLAKGISFLFDSIVEILWVLNLLELSQLLHKAK